VTIGSVGLDTLASLLLGPAFLVETEAGGFADAPFGRAPFDGLDGRIVLKVGPLGLGTYPPLVAVTAWPARTVIPRSLARASSSGATWLRQSTMATISTPACLRSKAAAQAESQAE